MLDGRRWSRPLQSCRAMRGLALVLGLITLTTATGCHYWQPEPAFPQRPAKAADDVRLTLRDGRRVFIEQARVQGDSVIGRQGWDTAQVAIPLSSVQRAEGRWFHPGRTGGLVVGIALVAAVGLGIAVAASMGSMGGLSGGW